MAAPVEMVVDREQPMRRLPVLSASKLTLAEHCLFPWTSGIEWQSESGESARFGSAVHAAAEELVLDPERPMPIDELAVKYELSESKAKILEGVCCDILDLLDEETFDVRTPEQRIAYDPIRGTVRELPRGEERAGGEMILKIDLTIESGGLVTIRDWKTGKRPVLRRVAETLQVRAYALAVARLRGLDEVRVELAWCSQRGIWIDHAHFDAFDFAVIEEELRQLALEQLTGKAIPHYGLHCREHYCPILGQCPAAQEAARRVAESCSSAYDLAGHFEEIEGHEHALEILRLLPLVSARAEAAKRALEEWVRRNGALELGDGRSWGPVEHTGNDRLTASERAIELLREQLGEHAEAALDTKTTITKASIDRGIKALVREAGDTKRGALKRRRDALHEELRACGALKPGAPYTKFEAFKRAYEPAEVN